MGWVQGHHLEKIASFSGSEVAAAAAEALRVFACSPVHMNMHCLFSGRRGANPHCFSSLSVASSTSERSVLPTVVDFEKLSLEVEAMELRRLLWVSPFHGRNLNCVSGGLQLCVCGEHTLLAGRLSCGFDAASPEEAAVPGHCDYSSH